MKPQPVIHLELTLDPDCPADMLRSMKASLHDHAMKISEGAKNRAVMSVIRLEEIAPASRSRRKP